MPSIQWKGNTAKSGRHMVAIRRASIQCSSYDYLDIAFRRSDWATLTIMALQKFNFALRLVFVVMLWVQTLAYKFLKDN